jgi:hypothetical protein
MYIHWDTHERNHNFINQKMHSPLTVPTQVLYACTAYSPIHVHTHTRTHTCRRCYFPSGLRPIDLLSLRARPFSKSSGRIRGVGGMSSLSFVRPRRLERVEPLTERGNSDRLGVRAVATFFVDLLIVSLMVHSRFLAMKKREAVDTRSCQRMKKLGGLRIYLLPTKMTTTTTTMMATRAPVERVMELAELSPAAPASVPSTGVMLPDWPCHESSVARGKYADVADMVICP